MGAHAHNIYIVHALPVPPKHDFIQDLYATLSHFHPEKEETFSSQ